MSATGPIPRDPDCWRCTHPVHTFACEHCDCPTSVVGACWNHDKDMTDDT